MKNAFVLFLIGILCSSSLLAQEKRRQPRAVLGMEEKVVDQMAFAKTINAKDLRTHLEVIASDAFDPRKYVAEKTYHYRLLLKPPSPFSARYARQ